jgi:PAS domain S-box-containing protein
MNREEFFYLLPYLLSLAISMAVFLYTWRHRHVRGAQSYSWLMVGQTLTILGFILELISSNLQTKILWDKFQWLTDSFLVFIPFLIFAVRFTEHKIRNPRLTGGFWIGIPILFTLLLLTDDLHHLLYPNPHLSTDYPFPELQYDFTILVYLYAVVYVYVVNFYGIGLLIKRALQPHNAYRNQYWTIALGFLIPLFLSFFTLANIRITPQRDAAPFSLAIGNLIVAWGLFRYGLFDIVPIARERIVEDLRDPVFVLDARNRVLDVNQAALQMLRENASRIMGRPAKEVFAKWPVIVSELEYLDVERREITIQENGDTFYFDINISSIYNNRRQLIGRIVAARDITRYKTLESGYRLLSRELEQRVRERTEELRHSAELYRTVVENQTEFIVRWKANGIRTFVNEAYCRYFGLTPEQALSSSFMPLIAEEDRQAIEEKIARLSSGAVVSETETHRVIKPDGRVAWQEWTDQAIHNEMGQIVEFQSIGRDVTDREQAEEALRESEAIYRRAIEVAGGVPYRQSYPEEEFHIIYDFIGEGISQITGYKAEEFSETLWDSLVQESQLVGDLTKYSWREAVQRVRSGASPIWQCEHRIRTRNGETRWIYETAVELRDKEGKSHGSIGLFQDITARKQAEEALRQSEERFSKAFQSSPVIITISQINSGILLEVNEAFEKVMGFSRDEVIGKTAAELRLWANLADRVPIMQKFIENGELRNEELQFRTKQGEIITCNYSAELIELGGEKCSLAIVEDITERKKAEARILRLNRLYATISHINQTIVHARDKESLFREICRVATEHGQFRMAWIGLVDQAGDSVLPIIFMGDEQGYLANIQIRLSDRLLGRGPTGTAIREGRCIICQDIASDPRMLPWRERALQRGYRSSAAVPLREKGRVVGNLTVYAAELQGFDTEDEELLEQIGLDVSFALDSIDAEIRRERAEADLAEAYDTTLEGWAKALELRDKETEGHSRRVTAATVAVARAMGFHEPELIHVRRGSILHDIGKMGIPDYILRKNGPLTAEERAVVQKHPKTAYELLRPISYLEEALEIPYCHHEKWDGSGYPRGLKEEEIPLAARIFAVVDVWDALSSDRPYRSAWPREKVADYLVAESGKHFDPQVIKVFLQMMNKGEI